MKFKESRLAHKYCHGEGIEIGPASHNPFNIPGCLFISPKEGYEFFKQSQIDMGEEPQKIDFFTTADDLPFFKDNSLDYIITSHVIEHIPDLISTFKEWDRVLKGGGIVFIIAPKRNALQADIGRPLSDLQQIEEAYNPMVKGQVDEDRHVWVFDLQLLADIINTFTDWSIVDMLETDDKVGNGHCIVCRK